MPFCSSCGESEVEREDINGHEQLICLLCGTVQEEDHLVQDSGEAYLTSDWKSQRESTHSLLQSRTSAQRTCSKWREKLKHLCQTLKFSPDQRDKALSLLHQAQTGSDKRCCMTQARMAIIALHAARECGRNIGVVEVARAAGVDYQRLLKLQKKLAPLIGKRTLPTLNVHQMCEDNIDRFHQHFNLTAEDAQLAKRLAEVCEHHFLGTGQRPDVRCLACLCVLAERAQTNGKTIRRILKVDIELPETVVLKIRRLASEIKGVLHKMAEQLPWYQGGQDGMSDHEMLSMLPDIVKYSVSLSDQASSVNPSGPLLYDCTQPLYPWVKRKEQEKLRSALESLFQHLSTRHSDKLPSDHTGNNSPSSEVFPSTSESQDDPSLDIRKNNQAESADHSKKARTSLRSSRGETDTLSLSESYSKMGLLFDYCTAECSLDEEEQRILNLLKKGFSVEDILSGQTGMADDDDGSLDEYGDRCELDDDDIPDEKLNQYIRTGKEVTQVCQLQS